MREEYYLTKYQGDLAEVALEAVQRERRDAEIEADIARDAEEHTRLQTVKKQKKQKGGAHVEARPDLARKLPTNASSVTPSLSTSTSAQLTPSSLPAQVFRIPLVDPVTVPGDSGSHHSSSSSLPSQA